MPRMRLNPLVRSRLARWLSTRANAAHPLAHLSCERMYFTLYGINRSPLTAAFTIGEPPFNNLLRTFAHCTENFYSVQ